MSVVVELKTSGLRRSRVLGAVLLVGVAVAAARPQSAPAAARMQGASAAAWPQSAPAAAWLQSAPAAEPATPRPTASTGARDVQSGIAEAARIEGRHLPEGQPWSPDGRLLAVVHPTGLALWDAHEPSAEPRAILDADVLEVRWSPDGTWLCCRVRVMNGTRGGAVRFQFVPATGRDAEYRIPNAAIGNWVWADDGKVHFWNGKTGVRQEVAPPRAWLAAQPQLPATPRAELVLAAGTDRRRPRQRPLLFTPGTPPVEQLVDSLYLHSAVQPWCRIEAPAPAAPRWIVTTRDGRDSETTLVNERGGRIAALQPKGEPALQHVSSSADGSIVAGQRCAAADTARACTRIWIGSLDPPEFSPMDWEGRNPSVAPQGRHIAIETTTGHAVRVFKLQNTAR